MSEMVGRVARAIQAKCRERGFNECPAPLVHHVAWAAIEAMREPTEAMLKAPEMATWAWVNDERVEPEEIADAWRAMIDAALGDK